MLTTATEMRNNFSHYLTQVTDENKEVIITKNNVRVARLVPYVSDIEKYFTVRENAVNYDYHRKQFHTKNLWKYVNTSTRMNLSIEIFIIFTNFHQAILEICMFFQRIFKEEKCRLVIAL